MFERAKNFVKSHKKEFIAGGLIGGITGAVVGGVTAYFAYKAGYEDGSFDVMKEASDMFPMLIHSCGYEGMKAAFLSIEKQAPDVFKLVEAKISDGTIHDVQDTYLDSPFIKELVDRTNELRDTLRG